MKKDPSSVTSPPLPERSKYQRKRRSFDPQFEVDNQAVLVLGGKRQDPENQKFPINPLKDLQIEKNQISFGPFFVENTLHNKSFQVGLALTSLSKMAFQS